MFEQIEFIYSHIPQLLFGFPGQRPGGLLLSILLAILAIGIGFVFALLVGTGQQSRSGLVRWICQRYIDIFRGLPLILLVIIIYQLGGIRYLGFDINPLAAALTALILYSSAYYLSRASMSNPPGYWAAHPSALFLPWNCPMH
jgi:His/Glu/Gln/Arg/opine family amino acid ABC transporter permease subunit